MKVYTSIEEFTGVENPIVTVGTFDGVHHGHRVIINRLNSIAKKGNGESVLLTFHPHPRLVLFSDDSELRLLNTQDEKVILLENAGIQHLVIIPFTIEFSRLSATEYVRDVLVNGLGIKKLVIGYDHHFGRNRTGGLDELSELAATYRFVVEEIPAQEIDDVKVSSTKIRKALHQGNIKTANQFLESRYMLTGTIVEGDKLGRTIGFPTANIRLNEPTKLVPANGVYAVTIQLDNGSYKGMLNIGKRPTVSNTTATTIEVHIFDFHNEIYGNKIRVELLDKIRDEVEFDNVDELQSQLEKDRIRVLNL